MQMSLQAETITVSVWCKISIDDENKTKTEYKLTLENKNYGEMFYIFSSMKRKN